MRKGNRENFIGKMFNTVVIAPIMIALILWVWMWGVFSVEYLHHEIMQHDFSAFIYKEIYDTVAFYTNSHTFNPRFIATTLTLTVVIVLIGIALGIVSFFVKSVYKSFIAFEKKEPLEEEPEQEEETQTTKNDINKE